MTMPRLYIAGPYSLGDTAVNVRVAIDAANAALALGAAPYIPHLNHFWHLVYPHDYEEWLELDFAWLAMCEAVWRLSGRSAGADREVAEAQRLGLPVFTTLREVYVWVGARKREPDGENAHA